MNDTISVLVAARKNSKYLAKFLFGYFANTFAPEKTEVIVMLNAADTWNDDLVNYYENFTDYPIRFLREDHKLGRAGLAIYLNELLPYATGQWIVYFCEDHYINFEGWDAEIRKFIADRELNSTKVYTVIPKFDNAGTMNHILSRGFVDQIGGYLAQHGNLDSYINDVIRNIPRDRRLRMDQEIFHDFTHDIPSPMDDSHLQSVISRKGKLMPKYDSDTIRGLITMDSQKLQQAIREGF